MMYFVKSFLWPMMLIFAFSPGLLANDMEVLKPSMKAVDRDWEYFESIPCEDINKIVTHSRAEESLLAKRKQQCIDRYKAYYSRPVSQ